MKAFFEQCLRDLHRLTGLKQYLEICNKPTEAEAKEEMDIIVAGMVRVSEKFNYIPQDAQKRIVTHQIVSDPEMYALNAKIVYKWFNAVSDKYWHESGHLETTAARKDTEIKEEEQKRIDAIANKFLAELAGGAIKEVPKVSEIELLKIKNEDKERVEGKKAIQTQVRDNSKYLEQREKLLKAAEDRGLNKLSLDQLKKFEVFKDVFVWARNLEEAQEIYIEVYS